MPVYIFSLGFHLFTLWKICCPQKPCEFLLFEFLKGWLLDVCVELKQDGHKHLNKLHRPVSQSALSFSCGQQWSCYQQIPSGSGIFMGLQELVWELSKLSSQEDSL